MKVSYQTYYSLLLNFLKIKSVPERQSLMRTEKTFVEWARQHATAQDQDFRSCYSSLKVFVEDTGTRLRFADSLAFRTHS